MNIKINGFQEDHGYLEAQRGECFVLKTKDILGPPFLNTYLLIYLRMYMTQTNRCTTSQPRLKCSIKKSVFPEMK